MGREDSLAGVFGQYILDEDWCMELPMAAICGLDLYGGWRSLRFLLHLLYDCVEWTPLIEDHQVRRKSSFEQIRQLGNKIQES